MTAAPVVELKDVVFAAIPGYRPLSLDLYLGEQPRALCVYLHGGGWRVGTRADGPGPLSPASGTLFARMARRGLAVASVDYRLSAEAVFPAQRDDVAAACAFLAENRAALGLPDVPLVVWGVSAGGHLAALRALDAEASPQVRAAVCWYPPTDLVALPDDVDAVGGTGQRGPQARESELLGAALGSIPYLAAAASPVSQVHGAAPPFLFVHGTGDVLVPQRQSERLAAALTAAGASARIELVDGAPHMFTGIDDAELYRLVDLSADFLLAPR